MECEIISEDEACKVVIDTSILMANLWEGKSREVVELWKKREDLIRPLQLHFRRLNARP